MARPPQLRRVFGVFFKSSQLLLSILTHFFYHFILQEMIESGQLEVTAPALQRAVRAVAVEGSKINEYHTHVHIVTNRKTC